MRRKIDTIQLMRDINAVLKYVSCDLVYFVSFLEVEGGKDRFLGIMSIHGDLKHENL
jgi:hypothetical protein